MHLCSCPFVQKLYWRKYCYYLLIFYFYFKHTKFCNLSNFYVFLLFKILYFVYFLFTMCSSFGRTKSPYFHTTKFQKQTKFHIMYYFGFSFCNSGQTDMSPVGPNKLIRYIPQISTKTNYTNLSIPLFIAFPIPIN